MNKFALSRNICSERLFISRVTFGAPYNGAFETEKKIKRFSSRTAVHFLSSFIYKHVWINKYALLGKWPTTGTKGSTLFILYTDFIFWIRIHLFGSWLAFTLWHHELQQDVQPKNPQGRVSRDFHRTSPVSLHFLPYGTQDSEKELYCIIGGLCRDRGKTHHVILKDRTYVLCRITLISSDYSRQGNEQKGCALGIGISSREIWRLARMPRLGWQLA